LKKKTFVFLIVFAGILWAHDEKHAIDLGVNISVCNATYKPVLSSSFYWLKGKRCHEITLYYFNDPKGKSGIGEWFNEGIFYSYLINVPVKYLFAGPTIGLLASRTETHTTVTDFWGSPQTEYEFKDGLYFGGLNILFMMGQDAIRLKIQERLLAGMSILNRDVSYGLHNTLGAGLVVAF
jgi:hypothetical protein